jgi:polysaccharide export outer membrane protein
LNHKNCFSLRICEQPRSFARVQFAFSIASLVLMSILALAAPRSALAQDAAAPREPYTINPGDLLEISIWKEPDLQRQVLVRPDGAFSFPLSGDVVAIGRTVEAVRRELTNRLSTFIPDLVVTVTVAEINGNKIYVIGQVNSPGQFVVNPRVDVIQALSIAGGMTPFAESNDIKILRRRNGVQTILRFRYNDIIKGQNLQQNVLLEVGDVVLVP